MHKTILSSLIFLSIFSLSGMEQPALDKLFLLERLPQDMQIECLKHAARPYIHQAIKKIKTYGDFEKVTTGATVAYIPCAVTNHHFNKLIQEKVAPAILAEQDTQELVKNQVLNNFLSFIHGKRVCFIERGCFMDRPGFSLQIANYNFFTEGIQSCSVDNEHDPRDFRHIQELFQNSLARNAFWNGLYYCYRNTKDKELFPLMQILFDHGLEIEKHYYNLPDDCSELKAFLDKNKSHISAK